MLPFCVTRLTRCSLNFTYQLNGACPVLPPHRLAPSVPFISSSVESTTSGTRWPIYGLGSSWIPCAFDGEGASVTAATPLLSVSASIKGAPKPFMRQGWNPPAWMTHLEQGIGQIPPHGPCGFVLARGFHDRSVQCWEGSLLNGFPCRYCPRKEQNMVRHPLTARRLSSCGCGKTAGSIGLRNLGK
jgi:hypothetical protein